MQSDSVMQQHICKSRGCYLSQQLVELADSKLAPMLQDEAKQSDFSATGQLEQLGEVTVGITRADGHKCARYTTLMCFVAGVLNVTAWHAQRIVSCCCH